MITIHGDAVLSSVNVYGKGLRTKLDYYRKRASLVEKFLFDHPDDWGRFQNEFNSIVNMYFTEVANFARNNTEKAVDKLRTNFVKNYRDLFIRGDLNARSLTKPYGYAGDFEIIDDIYLNQPKTNGFDRLFDNYFQMSSVCNAVRNRKEDFKRIIIDFINTNYWRKLRILDLASGPCRELLEMGLNPHVKKENIEIDCLDHDPRSLLYAKRLLEETPLKVDFKVQNALKLCTERSVQKILPHKYDLIYSTGLFDYLSDRTTISLIASLYSCLNPGGVLVVSDVRDKGSNPSAYYMEWVGEWELTYKEDGELFDCFVSAGIEKKKLNIQYEQQGIFQYILAKR